MIEHKGVCMYCGQIGMIEGPDDMSQEEIDNKVTLKCTCQPALAKAYAEKFKQDANSYIDMMIEKEGVNRVMKAAAELIAEHQAEQMTITHGGMKYSIKRGKTGPKVEVTVTKKEVME